MGMPYIQRIIGEYLPGIFGGKVVREKILEITPSKTNEYPLTVDGWFRWKNPGPCSAGKFIFMGGKPGKMTSPKTDLTSKTNFGEFLVFSVSNQEICMMRPLIRLIIFFNLQTITLHCFLGGEYGGHKYIYLHSVDFYGKFTDKYAICPVDLMVVAMWLVVPCIVKIMAGQPTPANVPPQK